MSSPREFIVVFTPQPCYIGDHYPCPIGCKICSTLFSPLELFCNSVRPPPPLCQVSPLSRVYYRSRLPTLILVVVDILAAVHNMERALKEWSSVSGRKQRPGLLWMRRELYFLLLWLVRLNIPDTVRPIFCMFVWSCHCQVQTRCRPNDPRPSSVLESESVYFSTDRLKCHLASECLEDY